jgi:HlyD family secretion protein
MSDTPLTPQQELTERLNEGTSRSLWKKIALWGGAPLLLLILLLVWFSHRNSGVQPYTYKTSAVTRSDLDVAVSATGNLAPTNSVDVGSEQSGTIEKVLVEANDHVKVGQVLAQLEPSKLLDAIKQAESTLAATQATLQQDEATVKESQANLNRLKEVSKLSGGKVPSKSDMDTAVATYDRAVAARNNQQALVKESQAELSTARINLSKGTIRSPINGTVLTRDVQVGQTVAAAMSVTTLFTIAEDLTKMDLDVYVDEADVGSVHQGQSATFTVDAYPNRTYTANVKRVNFGSTTKDNVVSYITLLQVKNDDLTLRPGMTATASIATQHRHNVLLAPNAALRFVPPAASAKQGGLGLHFGPPGDDKNKTAESALKGKSQQLWVLRNGQPVAVPVTVGITNGQLTEILGGDLHEGDQVITEAVTVK